MVFVGFSGTSVMAAEASQGDILKFLGRLHPMVLHFPIGLLTIALLLEMIALFKKDPGFRQAISVVLILGMVSAILTALFGWLLSRGGGYDADLVWWHRLQGISVAVLSVLVVLCRRFYHRGKNVLLRVGYRLLLMVCVGILLLAGHNGASMTHGSNYLYEYMPDWLAAIAAPADAPEEPALVEGEFAATIWPILKAKCVQCHGPEKQKRNLRLDRKKSALRSIEPGQGPIVPGNAMASKVVKHICLPKDHEGVMPPAGKGELSPAEIMAIIDWINRGAEWPEDAEQDTADVPDPADMEKNEGSETPDAAETESPVEADVEAVSFHGQILLILRESCFGCHGPEKQKGKLRLDSPEAILAGSEQGPVLVAGKPAESKLYTLTILPPDHEDSMPAKGDPLTKQQTELLRLWILQGALFDSPADPVTESKETVDE
jgi:uncharacterized membrane protein/mono/diheme cytochrome c family protein